MSATTQERLLKRKINEMEDDIKRLQKELEKLKRVKKSTHSRSNKQLEKILKRESDLMEVFEDIETEKFERANGQYLNKDSVINNPDCCRVQECRSRNTKRIALGNRRIIICEDCGGKFTTQNTELAKTG